MVDEERTEDMRELYSSDDWTTGLTMRGLRVSTMSVTAKDAQIDTYWILATMTRPTRKSFGVAVVVGRKNDKRSNLAGMATISGNPPGVHTESALCLAKMLCLADDSTSSPNCMATVRTRMTRLEIFMSLQEGWCSASPGLKKQACFSGNHSASRLSTA